MMFTHWLRRALPICLSFLLFLTACAPAKKTSPYAQTQKETTRWGAPSAVAKKAEQGATFNQFFPGPTGRYDVVPSQEKKGFAEYKLNQDGKTVAMLSISDTTSIPGSAAKYQNSTLTVAGYPAVNQGSNGTGILINDRYQVKVLSRDPVFTQEDRVAWLQKFDLRGLAKLEPDIISKTAPSKTAPLIPNQAAPAKTALPAGAGAKASVPATAPNTTQPTAPVPQLPALSPQPAA